MHRESMGQGSAVGAVDERRGEALFRPARPKRAVDQIVDQIEGLLRAGVLGPGDRLPSERVLAEQFDVSRNTVREALRILEFTGVLVLRRGSSGGAFIARDGQDSVVAGMVRALGAGAFGRADLARAHDVIAAIDTGNPVLRVFLRALEEFGETTRRSGARPDRGAA